MQFQDATNAQDFGSFKDAISADSDDWILGDTVIRDFMETYLKTFIPLTYTITNIQQTSNIDAIVDAQGDFFGVGTVTVQFVMRKHDEVWKIRQYWDDASGSFSLIWQKINDGIPL